MAECCTDRNRPVQALSLLAALVATVGFCLTESASAQDARSSVFENGLWFDGESFVPDQWYAIDGRLTREPPAEIDQVVDLAGQYVLPGLTEAHNHDLQTPFMAETANERYLAHGIYRSVQMCAGSRAAMDHVAELDTAEAVQAKFVGACVSAPDGHPLGIALSSMRRAGMDPDPDSARNGFDPVSDVDDIDALFEGLAAQDVGMIKLVLIQTGRYDATLDDENMFGFRGLAPELARLTAERARKEGVRVVAHIETADDFAFAVEIGADLIAHLPGYRLWEGTRIEDYQIGEKAARRAAARGTVVITTAGTVRFGSGEDGPDDALLAMQKANLRTLLDADVALAIGSDNPMGTVIDEIDHLDGLEVMTRPELLTLATARTAAAMFPSQRYGTFQEDAEASFSAYVGDPIENLETLRRPTVRVRRGRLLSSEEERRTP